jgi:hypothetical protein
MPDRSELGRTLSSEEFSAMSVRAAAETAPAPPPASPDDPGPVAERLGVAEQLRRLGLPTPPAQRLEVGAILGAGATARIYAAQDHDLERPVAIKLLSGGAASAEDIGRFVEEARITASLSHPNVLPVHELEVNSRGQVFFTMKRIDGRSLGAVVTQAELGDRQPPLNDLNALVSVFIGVCQALAYAHKRRIVHQDVKPDNIMLGDFGEVLLVDWGSAVRLGDGAKPRLYGTPLYMSPEQARLEGVDERSDVYCVGASLFHALLLRVPVWNDDVEQFWREKKSGAIAEPTAVERRRVPAQLLAIALKALAADPAARYRDAAELLEDLRRYQGGLAVSAYRESAWQRLRRWHRRHARAFWSWTAAALVVLALGAALLGERIEQMAYWGKPISEPLDATWSARWLPTSGRFAVEDGSLVSKAKSENTLVYRAKLSGPTAIEFTGERLPGAKAGDISLKWMRAVKEASAGHGVELTGNLIVQIGAWNGTMTLISEDSKDHDHTLARSDFVPQSGRPFRARIEIEDTRIALSIDGHELCSWSDPFPLENGYFALWAMDAGKAYSDIRIYHRELPAKVPATAIGDAEARAEQYELAEGQYARVARSQEGTRLGREALFKQGLCQWRQHHEDQAMALWAPLAGSEYADDVELFRLSGLFAAHDHAGVLEGLRALYARAAPEVRRRIVLQWGLWSDTLRGAGDLPHLGDYVSLHDAVMRDDHGADHNVALALLSLGRHDELLARFPQERWLACQVFNQRLQFDRIVRDYPDQLWDHSFAAYRGGMWSEMDPEVMGWLMWEMKHKAGRCQEILDTPDAPIGIRAAALYTLGRLQELLATDESTASKDQVGWVRLYQTMALAVSGATEAPARFNQFPFMRALVTGDVDTIHRLAASEVEHGRADAIAAIIARAAGDRDRFHALLPKVDSPLVEYPPTAAVTVLFAAPLIDGLDTGDFTRFDRACEDFSTRWPYVQSQFHRYFADRILDRVDDARFLAQPCSSYAKANLPLALGMRADRHGDRASALAAYREFAATPMWARGEDLDCGLQRFAEWRVRELEAK